MDILGDTDKRILLNMIFIQSVKIDRERLKHVTD